MVDRGAPAFWTQADAFLRKSLTAQKRNVRSNILLISFPLILCLLLLSLQYVLDRPSEGGEDGQNDKPCQGVNCPVPFTAELPPLLQVPAPKYRAVKTGFIPFEDLPDESCKRTDSCPATILVTGHNHSFGKVLAGNLLPSPLSPDKAYRVVGSFADENSEKPPLFSVQDQCTSNSTFLVNKDMSCVQGLHLWRNSSFSINDELYKGYSDGNSKKMINEIVTAYDFLNSSKSNFNVHIWYNASIGGDHQPLKLAPPTVNLVSNAYLKSLRGPDTHMLFEFTKDFPQLKTEILRFDISSVLGQIFYTIVILQLFPVVLKSLVYEKQQKLRMMMKMHGLGDGPYWLISYAYFLFMSVMYMLCFVLFGSVIGLKFFTLNSYSVQFVFYFIYLNLQISIAFLVSALLSDIKTATVIAYLSIFATFLVGNFFFLPILEHKLLPRNWIIVMELFPFMSLYRGIYELAQHSFEGYSMGTAGMQLANLMEKDDGVMEVLIIMLIEWVGILFIAFYIDRATSSGKGSLFFLRSLWKKPLQHSEKPREGSGVHVEMDKADVTQEREKVESLVQGGRTGYAIICNELKKVYPGRDGNADKLAVKGFSLALAEGECFGLLGPNGAGKTSIISMMIGLTKPTSGTALVNGLDLRTQMDRIHTCMGVCPQHDLLWDNLTGREHLLFYGRLKNLKGSALTQAVKESLEAVKLFHGGIADKAAGKYSGGMKRRLSVAISLIGDPKVVYMDEPSTGLDPASRYTLWNAVKQAKRDRAIILTTHSMEEAEALCGRIGIFVDGSLQCVGNSRELKGRYGGTYTLTMTTSGEHEEEVVRLVQHISANARKVYQISGTLKFELPKDEVRIADVFGAVEYARTIFPVSAWGIADTTLEDVFIKVATGTSKGT